MPTIARRITKPLVFGPGDNGLLLSPEEFDHADFEEGWRYELVQGVLIVSPIPAEQESVPNDYLGGLLWMYREYHPQGSHLDSTLPERFVYVESNRRRADRLIWAGLGRKPRKKDAPTIAAEFVSRRKRDRTRDYFTKRDEYLLQAGVQEYWVFDRFERSLTVFTLRNGAIHEGVIKGNRVYKPRLLPGFELPLQKLWELTEGWPEEEE
jgi:Uma2 family endonuclease